MLEAKFGYDSKFTKSVTKKDVLQKKRTLGLKIQDIICNQANNQDKRNTVIKSYTESGYTA